MSLPSSAMGGFVCDCGFSWSYSFTISTFFINVSTILFQGYQNVEIVEQISTMFRLNSNDNLMLLTFEISAA